MYYVCFSSFYIAFTTRTMCPISTGYVSKAHKVATVIRQGGCSINRYVLVSIHFTNFTQSIYPTVCTKLYYCTTAWSFFSWVTIPFSLSYFTSYMHRHLNLANIRYRNKDGMNIWPLRRQTFFSMFIKTKQKLAYNDPFLTIAPICITYQIWKKPWWISF